MRTETSLLSGGIEAIWLCYELHQSNDQEDRMARLWRDGVLRRIKMQLTFTADDSVNTVTSCLVQLHQRHCGSVPHDRIWLVQKVKPCGSGSRFRKSRYCWRTKNCASSMGLDVELTPGSYNWALLRTPQHPSIPPTTNTFRLVSKVAV